MNQILYTFRRTIQHYIDGSFILIAATVIAIIIANSPFSSSYFSFWEQTFSLQIGDFDFFAYKGESMTLMQVINEFLMAIFFFTIGLEIKREILVGEFSTMKTALLPIIVAIGGMVLPICIYLFFSHHGLESRGCAIPMATDIAFSLGILSLFGKRIPNGLKIFLAALAVADDLGGIAVIAIFYTGNVDLFFVGYAVIAILFLVIGARKGVYSKLYYCIGGLALWYFLLNSGIHATIAGVIAAFCIPAYPISNSDKYIKRIAKCLKLFGMYSLHNLREIILPARQLSLLKRIESSSDHLISPLQDMEDTLAPLVKYFIIPLFALANAGINISGVTFPDLFSGVGLSALAGLSVGKVVGIVLFSWLAIKLRIVRLPHGVNWRMFIGVAMLGGIGFTVSIFIADLSFSPFGEEGYKLLNDAKLGILIGSTLAAVIGYMILSLSLPQKNKQLSNI